MPLEKRTIDTGLFSQVVFLNNSRYDEHTGMPLLVFIDGDGDAALRHGRTSEDPTPSHPVALRLLEASRSFDGIYLSRPCTFGAAYRDHQCRPDVWTTNRFSPDVIASMDRLLTSLAGPERDVILVSFSGGTTIAMELAHRHPNVIGLLSLAGLLDVAAWARQHGFTDRLAEQSIVRSLPLPDRVIQLHVYGTNDTNVPIALARAVLSRDVNAHTLLLTDVDHECCWEEKWPAIWAAYARLMPILESRQPP